MFMDGAWVILKLKKLQILFTQLLLMKFYLNTPLFDSSHKSELTEEVSIGLWKENKRNFPLSPTENYSCTAVKR